MLIKKRWYKHTSNSSKLIPFGEFSCLIFPLLKVLGRDAIFLTREFLLVSFLSSFPQVRNISNASKQSSKDCGKDFAVELVLERGVLGVPWAC